MLQRFLFVGVGGSGGDTLRCLYRDLTGRLSRVGITEMPLGWQFLHVDTPALPEHRDGLAELPPGSYVPLVGHSVNYRIVAKTIEHKGGPIWADCAGWLPPADEVHISVEEGAGQYRAIGRALAVVRLTGLRGKLEEAITRLELAEATNSLNRVEQAMTGQAPAGRPRSPSVVVVSSLAGGTGSGVFLDVCDILRSLGRLWAGDSTALLYAPDVFGKLDSDKRQGVQANTLAALSELLAGYWNTDYAPDPVHLGHGLAINNQAPRRGPGRAFIVGASNGRLTFQSQAEVFAAIGRTVGAWATSAVIQQEFQSYVQANWQAAAQADPLDLFGDADPPFSALGYASVDLGRGLFHRYVTQCLARLCVERLLTGAEGAGDDDPAGVRRQTAIARGTAEFLGDLGFARAEEKPAAGVQYELCPPLKAALGEVRREIAAEAGDGDHPAQTWRQMLVSLIRERAELFLKQQLEQMHASADDWVDAIQRRLVEQVERSLVVSGLAVTEGIVRAVRRQLLDHTVIELQAHALEYAQKSQAYGTEIASSFHPGKARLFGRRARLHPAHSEQVQTALQRGVEAAFGRAVDAQLCRLTAVLLKDLAERLLEPLLTTLGSALEVLRRESAPGAAGRPPTVNGWPQGPAFAPPSTLHPTPTQFLIDPVDRFPAVFQELVALSVGTGRSGDALREATARILRHQPAGGGRGSVPLLEQSRTWRPEIVREWSREDVDQAAAFRAAASPADLLARAGAWARDGDHALGGYLRQSLRDALGGAQPTTEQQGRLDRFRSCFADALASSAPLVDLDGAYLSMQGTTEANGTPMITPIPLAEGTAGHAIATDLLLRHAGLPQEKAALLFDPSGRDEIEFTTFLSRPSHAGAFASLTNPIHSDWLAKRPEPGWRAAFGRWRRSRPLPAAVPLPTAIRRRLVRGWFVALLSNQIGLSDDGEAISVHDGDGSRLPFFSPSPVARPSQDDFGLLGALLEALPLVLVQPLQNNPEAAAYRRLIALGDPDLPLLAGHAGLVPELARLRAEAGQRFADVRRSVGTREWELRDDINAALADLHEKYGEAS